jgi:hypothetical protein
LLCLSLGHTAIASHNFQDERLNFLNTRLCAAEYKAWKNKDKLYDIHKKKGLTNSQDQQSSLDANRSEIKYFIIANIRQILGSSQQDLVDSNERLKTELHQGIDGRSYQYFFDQSLNESVIKAEREKIGTELHNLVDTIFTELTNGHVDTSTQATKPLLSVEEMETRMQKKTILE